MAEVFELFASTAPVNLKKIVLVVFESAVVQNFVNAIKNQVAGSYQQQPQVNLTDILKDHKTKMNKHLETIDVLLTADQKTNIQKAEKDIQAHMNSLKCEIKDDIIGKMDDDAILDIVKKAIEYKAVIVFDKTKVTVDDPLLSVTETAHQGHSNFRDYIYCYLADLREGLQLKKTCIWQYRDNGNIITIPPAKSLKLEKQLEVFN
uniref:Uncharacterized protein LOC100182562 n=1 Tax=Phallusia mammillata TaxID=59560 RepID=A0A6F9DHW6_9ASCI|nr:uncharacterized protein LOC100182562 [Phallusia mammillata]